MQITDLPDSVAFQIRVEALKKAAIVMNAIAETMQEGETKLETKSLAWIITWAVGELETKNKEPK